MLLCQRSCNPQCLGLTFFLPVEDLDVAFAAGVAFLGGAFFAAVLAFSGAEVPVAA